MRYALRRAAFYLVALWAALTLNFALPRLMPGDPVDTLLSRLSSRGAVTADTRRSIELMLGSADSGPWWRQYLDYLGQLLRGDLGTSVTYFPDEVGAVIGRALPWTLVMVGTATVISFALGIGLGTVAGWRRGSRWEAVVPVASTLTAMPYFWLALVLLFVLAGEWGLFPISGGYDYGDVTVGLTWAFVGSAAYHAVLPALTIVLSSVGGWLLGMRNMMVATLSEDHVLTARAKGLPDRVVRDRYAARNAVLPSITGFAISLGFVVAGSIVMEQVFSYPGIGFVLLQAVQNSDYALMQGVFLVITLAVLGANLVMDLLHGLVDPRTRREV